MANPLIASLAQKYVGTCYLSPHRGDCCPAGLRDGAISTTKSVQLWSPVQFWCLPDPEGADDLWHLPQWMADAGICHWLGTSFRAPLVAFKACNAASQIWRSIDGKSMGQTETVLPKPRDLDVFSLFPWRCWVKRCTHRKLSKPIFSIRLCAMRLSGMWVYFNLTGIFGGWKKLVKDSDCSPELQSTQSHQCTKSKMGLALCFT